MFVFLNGEKERRQEKFRYMINPARSGLIDPAEIPARWYEADGETPRTFTLEFEYGRCDVEDETLAKWLIFHGICAPKCSHPSEREGSLRKRLRDILWQPR